MGFQGLGYLGFKVQGLLYLEPKKPLVMKLRRRVNTPRIQQLKSFGGRGTAWTPNPEPSQLLIPRVRNFKTFQSSGNDVFKPIMFRFSFANLKSGTVLAESERRYNFYAHY